MVSNNSRAIIDTATSTMTSLADTTTTPSGGNSGTLIFVYVSFAVGGAILIVIAALVAVIIIRHRRAARRRAAAAKLNIIGNTNIGATCIDDSPSRRPGDRRLTGSASALGYFMSDIDSCYNEDYIWHIAHSSLTSSASRTLTSSNGGISRQKPEPEIGFEFDYGEDDNVCVSTLHRSSPLAALNAIYTGDVDLSPVAGKDVIWTSTKKRSNSGRNGGPPRIVNGYVNRAFASDVENRQEAAAVSNDCKWTSLSWRARLRAGIVRSMTGSDPGSNRQRASSRRPSYLADVVDSLRFFSGEIADRKSAPADIRLPVCGNLQAAAAAAAATDESRSAAPVISARGVRTSASSDDVTTATASRWLGEFCLRKDSSQQNGGRVAMVTEVDRHAVRPPLRSVSTRTDNPMTYYTYVRQPPPPSGTKSNYGANHPPDDVQLF